MSLLSCLLSLVLLSIDTLADETPYHNSDKYNEAGFGQYVTQTFLSDPEVSAVPVMNFMKPFTNCDDGSFLFVAPRGNSAESTPMILDVAGSPIWASTTKYGQVYNLQVQQYKHEYYLTFWGGNDAVNGHGEGQYFMLDQHYNERYRVKAGNGMGGDLHVFTITSTNTALISIYQPIMVDISSKYPGRSTGWIYDSVFQEIDIETSEVIFQWRASTHVPLTNSHSTANNAVQHDPWDAYHINSVEKDDDGNFLVSFRYLYAIMYIDGRSGDILWQLGGVNNSFKDLSSGTATSFMGQHDAHWQHGHRYITFFDNRADWDHALEDHSKGTRIEIDLEAMTARLDATFTDTFKKILSTSQGSYQTLPNGNVVLGYGFNGVISEFSPSGELLCDAFFEPSSRFTTGDVQSYRNLRFNWTGYPDTDPKLATSGSKLFVSWNGATEVDSWLLIGSDIEAQHDEYEDLVVAGANYVERSVSNSLVVPKEGFETVLKIPRDARLGRYVRAIAINEDGIALGTTNIVDVGEAAANMEDDDAITHSLDLTGDLDKNILLGFGACAMLSTILVCCLILGSGWARLPKRFPSFRYTQLSDQDQDQEQQKAEEFTKWVRDCLSFRRKYDDEEFEDGETARHEGLLLAQHETAHLRYAVPEIRVVREEERGRSRSR